MLGLWALVRSLGLVGACAGLAAFAGLGRFCALAGGRFCWACGRVWAAVGGRLLALLLGLVGVWALGWALLLGSALVLACGRLLALAGALGRFRGACWACWRCWAWFLWVLLLFGRSCGRFCWACGGGCL